MSYWNYRVVRVPSEKAEEPYYFALLEVYYNDDLEITGWVHWDDHRRLVPGTAEDLAGELERMKQAFRRPVIDATSLPGYTGHAPRQGRPPA